MQQVLTMESLCNGAVQERVNRALRKVADNILDPNTEAKKKRKVTLELVFQPDEDDREDVSVVASVNTKLVPELGNATQLFIAKDLKNDVITITEHSKGEIKGQMHLNDMGFVTDPEKKTENNVVSIAKEG